MDDCNRQRRASMPPKMQVQIPLWTIVTFQRRSSPNRRCSVQIPLWTIVTKVLVEMDYSYLGSDSSMDDCNSLGLGDTAVLIGFRFLYGRL